MWPAENRKRYDRSQLRYPSDLTDGKWQLVEPLIAGLALRQPLPHIGTSGSAGCRRSWPQSSQAATWLPSSAVRQASMAAIALSCPRLKCPALALRQAALWLRKISATSSTGRGMATGGLARISHER